LLRGADCSLLRSAALTALLLLACTGAWPAELLPTDQELEDAHAVIGDVLLNNQNIFNLDDPKENNWLFRLANRLHIKTRPYVIRSQLRFVR